MTGHMDSTQANALPHTVPISGISVAEQDARRDLSALYHMIDLLVGWQEGIYTHISMRLPDQPEMMLIKRHELLFSEVTPANLVKVPIGADVDESYGVNRPGVVTHSAALLARDNINCSVHIHTEEGLALSAHPIGLRMLCQNALRFWNRIGYHDYEGLVSHHDEGKRISANLGEQNIVLVLRNHGLLIVGNTPRDCFERTRDLLLATRMQLTLEATGAELKEIDPSICDLVVEQWAAHDSGRGKADWPAWKRMLEKRRPEAL